LYMYNGKKYLLMQDYVVHISFSHQKRRHHWHHNIKFAFTCSYPSCIAKHFLHYQTKTCMIKRLFTFHNTSRLSAMKSTYIPFGQ